MKKGQKPGTSEEDRALWHHVTRSVRAYEKQAASPSKKPAGAKHGEDTKKPAPAALPAPSPAASRTATGKIRITPARPNTPAYDGGTSRDLKKKKWPIDKTIDLHGMTQSAAHDALARFVGAARKQGKRTLLVITGKGSRSQGGGVLRRLLPLWLAETPFAPYILAVTEARPEDGGTGAFYVRLKKPPAPKR